MLKKSTPVILILILFLGIEVAEAQWSFTASMPVAREQHAAVALNGMVYVIGGSGPVNTCYQYNTVTNTWSVMASMPTGVAYASAAALNGKIYVSGGVTTNLATSAISAVQVYDPGTNSWSTAASMPATRAMLGSVAVNGKLYVVGGTNGPGVTNTLWEYDPSLNSWTVKAPMPTARYHVTAEAANGKLYATGGWSTAATNANQEYDPATNTWTVKANMPTARYLHAGGTVLDNGTEKIFVTGGHNGTTWLNSGSLYDPTTNTWSALPNMLNQRGRVAGAASNNCIYMPGGFNGASINTSEVDCFPTALPVEYLFFTADKIYHTVLLKWATASETNNNYFAIERSSDADNFAAIGQVKGAGNSTSALNYSFNDEHPLGGTNYYRLNQVDYDGKFSFSNVVAVDGSEGNPSFDIYPNPAVGVINVNATDESVLLSKPCLIVYDVLGNVILLQEITDKNTIIDLKDRCSKGIYFIHVVDSEGTLNYSQKLIVQ